MKIAGAPVWAWIVAGLVATVVMDMSAGIARATRLTRGAPPQLIAKWFSGLPRGRFVVDDIRTSPGGPGSVPLFLPIHYLIGVSLTLLYGLLLAAARSGPPPWWLSVAYGTATTVLPAFWMFPSMGFGLLGLKAPAELLLLRSALLNHAFFGAGIAVAMRWIVFRS
jgi:hypothetical protein